MQACVRARIAPSSSRKQAPAQRQPHHGARAVRSDTLVLERVEVVEQEYVTRPVEHVDVLALNKRLEARAKAMIKLEEQEMATRTTVKIRLQKQVGLGESWKLVGKLPELGRFKPEVAPYLKWGNGHEWTYEGKIRPGRWEYKLVLRKADGAYVWESGPDRVLEVPEASGSDSTTVDIRINNVQLPQ